MRKMNKYMFPVDLTGRRFGKLTVVGPDYNNTNIVGRYWMCVCDCQLGERVPKQRSIREDKLLEGRTLSCGCNKLEQKTRSCHNTNHFDLDSNTYGIGYTADNEKFIFDKDDYGKIVSISESWHFNDGGYLEARDMRSDAEKYENGRRKIVYMKDIVMNKKKGEIVRIKDIKRKFDVRKSNLKKSGKAI